MQGFRRTFFLTALIVLSNLAAIASDTTSTRRKLIFSLGTGAALDLGRAGVPEHLDTRVQRLGPGVTARVMWHPEHLLRLGLESGWSTLYSYAIDGPGPEGSLSVTTIPLLLQFSMRVTPRFEAYAGWGTYRLTSTLNYLGKVRTSSYSQGYVAAVAYRVPIMERLTGAVELKWMNAYVTGHHLLAVQWRFDWRLVAW